MLQNQKKESELLRLRHKEKSKNEVVTIEAVQKEEPEEVKIEVSAPVQFKQVGKIDSLEKFPPLIKYFIPYSFYIR